MYQKIDQYIKTWESRCYCNGLPDEVPVDIMELAPSYKAIAIAILKNDYTLKTLGIQQPYSKWYDTLKKIELSERGYDIQLKLF